MLILIVDDDSAALDLLEHVLRKVGHQTVRASNGPAALEIVRGGEVRLVISDWQMPGMSGLELCRQIRACYAVGYVYFIMLTSRDSKNSVEALTAGADDMICKPFNPAEVAVRVRAAERILSIETRDLAIFAMAKLAESRDPETGKHLERVRHYARLLAIDLASQPGFGAEFDENYIRLIYLTSPLHDIGKVAIPDSVLLKPGRLSEREFEIMKTHTTLGAQTLDAALSEYPQANFLVMAKEIALTHHERFDGTGYPQKLKGDEIPWCGKIVALADVYDALTSRRPYKAAFAHEVARTMIVDEKGTHFDPRLIESFLRCEQAFIDAATKHAEILTPGLAA
jgi:putative two-component system response regulator